MTRDHTGDFCEISDRAFFMLCDDLAGPVEVEPYKPPAPPQPAKPVGDVWWMRLLLHVIELAFKRQRPVASPQPVRITGPAPPPPVVYVREQIQARRNMVATFHHEHLLTQAVAEKYPGAVVTRWSDHLTCRFANGSAFGYNFNPRTVNNPEDMIRVFSMFMAELSKHYPVSTANVRQVSYGDHSPNIHIGAGHNVLLEYEPRPKIDLKAQNIRM